MNFKDPIKLGNDSLKTKKPGPPKSGDLPGGPMPEWHLYQQRDLKHVDGSIQPLDYTDHLGKRHKMPPGTHLEAVQVPGGREVRIVHSFDLAKGVANKCAQKYEGKYTSGLFGVNVEINMAEMEEVNRLLQESLQILNERYTDAPITKKYWEGIIMRLEDDLQMYRAKDENGRTIAHGRTAVKFGENLKRLHGLLIETKRDTGILKEVIYKPSSNKNKIDTLAVTNVVDKEEIKARERSDLQRVREELGIKPESEQELANKYWDKMEAKEISAAQEKARKRILDVVNSEKKELYFFGIPEEKQREAFEAYKLVAHNMGYNIQIMGVQDRIKISLSPRGRLTNEQIKTQKEEAQKYWTFLGKQYIEGIKNRLLADTFPDAFKDIKVRERGGTKILVAIDSPPIGMPKEDEEYFAALRLFAEENGYEVGNFEVVEEDDKRKKIYLLGDIKRKTR